MKTGWCCLISKQISMFRIFYRWKTGRESYSVTGQINLYLLLEITKELLEKKKKKKPQRLDPRAVENSDLVSNKGTCLPSVERDMGCLLSTISEFLLASHYCRPFILSLSKSEYLLQLLYPYLIVYWYVWRAGCPRIYRPMESDEPYLNMK